MLSDVPTNRVAPSRELGQWLADAVAYGRVKQDLNWNPNTLVALPVAETWPEHGRSSSVTMKCGSATTVHVDITI